MKLSILGVCYYITIANAFCDICVDGQCGIIKPLLENVMITDQIAIDWKNTILYAQINLTANTAVYIYDFEIKKTEVVQVLETHGMAVDQDTQELYTAGHNNMLYKIRQGGNASDAEYNNGLLNGSVYLLYFADVLYYTKHNEKGLFFITSKGRPALIVDLANHQISNFVRTENSIIFVSNDLVYEFADPFNEDPRVIYPKSAALAVDIHDNLYLADASKSIIYKRDPETKRLHVHTAFKTGLVDQFLFDKFDNLITFDSNAQILAYWLRSNLKCSVEDSPCKLNINYNQSDVDSSLLTDSSDQAGSFETDFDMQEPDFF